MSNYKTRVIVEQKELAEKIVKLTIFITDFTKATHLSNENFSLLNRQLEVMIEYNRILQMRINLFEVENDNQ